MRDHFGNNLLSSDLNFARGIHILDDCEGTCNWKKSANDANATVSYETIAAWTGTKGLQLFSGDATPQAGDIVNAYKIFSYPETGLLVIRAKVGMPDISDIEYIGFSLIINNGTRQYTLLFLYAPASGKVYYTSSNGTLQEITELKQNVVDDIYTGLELIIDLNTMTYVSAMFNGLEKNMAGVSFYNAGANTNKYVQIGFYTTNIGVDPVTSYWDCIYVGEYVNV